MSKGEGAGTGTQGDDAGSMLKECCCCICTTFCGQTEESATVAAEALSEMPADIAQVVKDGYEGFVDVAGSSLVCQNDTRIPLWFKAGQNEAVTFVFTAIAVMIGLIGATVLTAGTMTAAACAAGVSAVAASLAAVNCVEHLRAVLEKSGLREDHARREVRMHSYLFLE